MALVNNRFSTTARGAVVITGNTIGLDKRSNALLPGNEGSQGAYITLGTLTTATGWGTQGALDPTVGIITNTNTYSPGSRAVLYIPPSATVLYAEVVWFATLYTGINPNATPIFRSSASNTPITLTPDPITANTVAMPNYNVYVRSSTVTNYVTPGTNTYTLTNIPARLVANENQNTCGGWCLIVAYEDPSESFKNLSIYVLGVPVRNDQTPREVSVNIPNVITPTTTPINGRAVIAAGEGDIRFSNDFVQFGATRGTQVTLSGPNNPATNFFTSAVNVGDYNGILPVGTVDTRGSMGNNNHNQTNSILGARQGIDITNVDISAGLTPNQTSAILTFDTQTDNYIPVAFGTQIEVVPSINKTVSTNSATLDSILTYSITITNPGTALPWSNVFFQDDIPEYTTFIPGSVTITGGVTPDPSFNPETGFIVANTLNKTSVTVTYQVRVTSIPPNLPYTVENIANATYDIITPTGTTTETLISDPVFTTIYFAQLSINKTTAPTGTVACGQTLLHTITVTNTGNTPATIPALFLVDDLPENANFIPNSILPSNLGIVYDTVSNTISNQQPITINTTTPFVLSYEITVPC